MKSNQKYSFIGKYCLSVFLLCSLQMYAQESFVNPQANPPSGCNNCAQYCKDADQDGFILDNSMHWYIIGSEPNNYILEEDSLGIDCNDNNSDINGPQTWYADTDQDGIGDTTITTTSCVQPANYVAISGDNCPTVFGSSALFGCPFSMNENYIYTRSFTNPINTISSTIQPTDFTESITYYDGLGRPKQNIDIKAGGQKQDIVTPYEYDSFGKQPLDYLPYAENGTQNGVIYNDPITNIHHFYDTAKYENTQYPYSEKTLESSNQTKIIELGAPGNPWHIDPTIIYPDSNHTIKYGYTANTINEVKKYKAFVEGNNKERHHLTSEGYFTENELYKTTVKDENCTTSLYDERNKKTQEFKDKDGHVILKRAFNKDNVYNTYYVYDDYGNLAYVIPPKASDAIDAYFNTTAVVARSFPWTKLAIVSSELATEYNRLFEQYKNELILTSDLFNQYGGQGGFTISRNDNEELVLSINSNTVQPMALKNGLLASLNDLGTFPDGELGKIKGVGYEYFFNIKNNAVVVEGSGLVSDINVTFNGTTRLVYSSNYPWASLLNLTPEDDAKYDAIYKGITNEAAISTYVENQYGALGGANITINENDEISLNLNITSTTPISLKSGLVVPLKTQRRIPDTDLGTIFSNDYKYSFSIKENSLYIDGSGNFTSMNLLRGSTTIIDINSVPKSIVEGLIYEYHYDTRNRLIEKRIPGKGWEYIVYDNLDRPVLTQDANQRIANKWLFTKYDFLNRVAYTGEVIYSSVVDNRDNDLRLELQNIYNNNGASSQNETRLNQPNGFSSDGITINYTQQIFPKPQGSGPPILQSQIKIFTVNYYDDYNFKPTSQTVTIPTVNSNMTLATNVKSLQTGALISVLDTNPTDWIINVMAYDTKGRLIATSASNSYLGTVDQVQSELDFTDKILETKTTQTKNNNTIVITDNFTYDAMGRQTKQTQTIGQHEELISYIHYDELGKVDFKKVGGPASNATSEFEDATALQSISYLYNVRGWLKQINDPATDDNLFSFKINYNTPELGATELYNGNISETLWKTSDNVLRTYTYSYNDLNQLKDSYFNGGRLSSNSDIENYNEGNITYDKNGNILTLERHGLDSNGRINIIDQLSYSYFPRSNKLRRVIDPNDAAGFSDAGNGSTDDYGYDINGNMKTDLNKNITGISYNHLNLPTKVVFNYQDPITSPHPTAIEFKYDATGVKLEKKVTNSIETSPGVWNPTTITTTEYAADKVYENDVLQFISQPEGYIMSHNNAYSYVYQYKDQLGNIRVSYTDNNGDLTITPIASGALPSEIVETNNYYPFGLKHMGNDIHNNIGNEAGQKYKFQGQERHEELGLNWDSFKWRNYDYTIGRFMNIDPLAEKYEYNSPYAFSENRVIDGFELEGLEVVLINPTKSSSTVQQKVADQKIVNGAKRISYNSTMITITGHGSTKGMSNDVRGDNIRTAEKLNALLNRNSDDWKNKKSGEGMTVVLYSCRTGAEQKNKDGSKKADSFAQKISASEDFRGVEIIAPDQRVYFTENGPIGTYEAKYAGPDDEYKANAPDHSKSNTSGNWNVFKNGSLIRSYEGDWTPTNNPSFSDWLFKQN